MEESATQKSEAEGGKMVVKDASSKRGGRNYLKHVNWNNIAAVDEWENKINIKSRKCRVQKGNRK